MSITKFGKIFIILFGISITKMTVAGDCSDFITQSRQVHTVLISKDELQNAAYAFCSEYSSTNNITRSTNFSGAYKLFSASFGDSGASESAVFSRFCSASSNQTARTDLYSIYLQTIAPEVYPVVSACLALQDRRKLSVLPTKIGPTEMQILIRNDIGSTNVAKLAVQPSSDVDCKWGQGGRANGAILELKNSQTTSLSCERRQSSKASWVTVYDSESSADTFLAVPWGIYNDKQEPVDTLDILARRLDGYWRQLALAVIPFESERCPDGWIEYVQAQGRFIRGIDKFGKTDAEGIRKPGSLQDDLFKAHQHSMTLPPKWGDKTDSSAGFGADDGHLSPVSVGTSLEGGGETRPKNVALLYCQKR